MFDVNIIIVIATIFIVISYWKSRSPSGLPPGPTGLPILGYLPFVGRKPQQTFDKLAKIYGPVFSLYLGKKLIIVLNNYEAIKEAFVIQGEIFIGRPNTEFVVGERDDYSVGLVNGDVWKTHRRFISNLFNELGVGKQSIEPLLMDEIQHFLVELGKFNGEPIDFSDLLNASVSNIIWIMIFGKRFEYDDEFFIKSRRTIIDFAANMSAVSVLHFFPGLSKIPGVAKMMNQGVLIQKLKDFKESLYILINERKKNYIEGQGGNYMDAFIGEQKERQKRDKNEKTFPDAALQQNVKTLMLTGTGTTVHSLLWCILCMVKFPNVQRRVQREIDEVIGSERTPLWSDRLRTPYTEATICEVHRFLTLIPMSLARKNIEDCELFGYKIPKDTTILGNLWSVHNDVKFWKDPEVFRPERFLSTNGEIDKKKYLIPFSIGKRDCLGISLAKMEMYLYLTSMLQKFTFESQDGHEPSMEVRLGFSNPPKYFNVRAMIRNNASCPL